MQRERERERGRERAEEKEREVTGERRDVYCKTQAWTPVSEIQNSNWGRSYCENDKETTELKGYQFQRLLHTETCKIRIRFSANLTMLVTILASSLVASNGRKWHSYALIHKVLKREEMEREMAQFLEFLICQVLYEFTSDQH